MDDRFSDTRRYFDRAANPELPLFVKTPTSRRALPCKAVAFASQSNGVMVEIAGADQAAAGNFQCRCRRADEPNWTLLLLSQIALLARTAIRAESKALKTVLLFIFLLPHCNESIVRALPKASPAAGPALLTGR
jgi:hypothetical protein